MELGSALIGAAHGASRGSEGFAADFDADTAIARHHIGPRHASIPSGFRGVSQRTRKMNPLAWQRQFASAPQQE
jgi:hypothetical protein